MMKKFRNVILLAGLLTIIVVGWLIPKTMGQKKTTYVRVYTQEQETADNSDTANTKKTEEKRKDNHTAFKKERKKKARVVIQKDTLSGRFQMKHLKPSLFSRSMHFVPEDYPVRKTSSIDSSLSEVDSLGVPKL